jgi:1,4-alpha-glucan branching enzyme
MKTLRWLSIVVLALGLTGCAGGWKNGPPSGTAATTAPAATQATAAAPAATGGTTFIWKGEGQTVHVAGDFNDWSTSADPLVKQADGTWALTKNLSPGRYAYKFVIDGGTWKEDPNAAETVDDGFGGQNSMIVVDGGGGGKATAAAVTATLGAGAATSAAAAASRPPELTADGVRFFFAGNHQSVHLAGDFNDWSTNADPLAKGEDGLWTILKKLAPGTYSYKFIVNESQWETDPANPEATDDGFGGKNSIVEVP